MRPPRYARSVSIINNGREPVRLELVYQDAQFNEKVELQPLQLKEFPEKSIDHGTWTAVSPVQMIKASQVAYKPADDLESVVGHMLIEVTDGGKRFKALKVD